MNRTRLGTAVRAGTLAAGGVAGRTVYGTAYPDAHRQWRIVN